MKVYVVMVDDRHTDPEPEVFIKPEDAITYAEKYLAGVPSYEVVEVSRWLFCATYSTEDDSIWVVEKELR